MAYEQNLFTGFSNLIMLMSVSFLIFCLVILKNNIKTKSVIGNKVLAFLLLSIVLSEWISTLSSQVLDISQYSDWHLLLKLLLINIWLVFMLLYLELSDIKELLESYYKIGILLAIINLLIMYNGSFLFWNKIYIVRGASIFYDPNFFGAFNMFLLLYYILFKLNKSTKSFLVTGILILSLILTFSKASVAAFVISLFFYFFLKTTLLKKILAIVIFMVTSILVYFIFTKLDFFRFSMGFNNRDNMASFFLDKISESPLFGYGANDLKVHLLNNDLLNRSFHNYLLDTIFAYGFITGAIIVLVITCTFFILKKYDLKLAILFFALVLNANFISYSIGGFGAMSILLTLPVIYAIKIISLKDQIVIFIKEKK
ncbi:O-antigen ligase [Sulfurovum sp. TSL6]|uniref:O-antigen ligase family protein n=1 Tax=Sulfurovum sp. TSL6 TaxID=2826995 RepID=UPI001CC6739E|nr:O-antigen ligase family protein [Sulfurovum sp. TSL6]